MARRVLSVCYEECLPPSTLELLEEGGCEMTCARAPGTAVLLFQNARFDLILINHTVSVSQEHLLVDLVRKKSDLPIILVSEIVSKKPDNVTVWIKPPVNPQQLLQRIVELVP